MRAYRGYSSIVQTAGWQWRTYHSLQLSLQRRFRNGLSFGFNDTIGLYDRQNVTPRLQHAADGTISVRADQAEADKLLGDNNPQAHIIKANFVWDLPDMHGDSRRDEGARRAGQRLAAGRHLDGGDRQRRTPSGYSYQNGGGNVNITGSPRLRRPRPHRRRHRQRLQQRSVAPVQRGGVPGSADRQRRSRVGQQLSEGVLPERARPVAAAQHQRRRRPRHPVPRRRVQRVQRRRGHQPQHDRSTTTTRATR